jgi:hypothetical protein
VRTPWTVRVLNGVGVAWWGWLVSGWAGLGVLTGTMLGAGVAVARIRSRFFGR